LLHLTNGDCAVPALRAAGADGEILPWSEVLHDGPVPQLEPEELRAVRARFLDDDEGLLARRDRRLATAITANEPLTQRSLAASAWAAFTADDPRALEPLAAGTPALPAVGQALRRLLEELPWTGTGLGRTERQLLEALADGARTREEAFHAAVVREERPFLGDASAWAALERLAPLLDDGHVNERGRAVLEAREEWEPPVERWIGGTRLPPGRPPWHWDSAAGRVAAP
jgi:hypothetical protein